MLIYEKDILEKNAHSLKMEDLIVSFEVKHACLPSA